MQEVLIKTHLIVTDVHEEYYMDWCGKILDADPELVNGLPLFIIRGGNGRTEISTLDMGQLEKSAKLMTLPRGRSAVASDEAKIFIKEKNGRERLMGILTHNHVKQYAQMYDKVGYR